MHAGSDPALSDVDFIPDLSYNPDHFAQPLCYSSSLNRRNHLNVNYPPPPALIKFLRPYDVPIRDLALRLRELLLTEMGPCYENIYDAFSAVAIGYGFGSRPTDSIFHIAVYGKHVNLGFNSGATLDDPNELLEGSGKQIRHISIKQPEDLERRQLRGYIRRAMRQASADARKLGEAPPKRPATVVSTVKAIYARKRRPR